MRVSGPALGITGGQLRQQFAPSNFTSGRKAWATVPGAARAKVRETVKYGAEVIKICASGVFSAKATNRHARNTRSKNAGHRDEATSSAARSPRRARHAIHQGRHRARHRTPSNIPA